MSNETKEILHILGPLSSLGAGQMGCELEPDTTLGFRMWGGKDALGNVSKFLAKGKPGQLQTAQLTGESTTGKVGFLMHDEEGNVTGGHGNSEGGSSAYTDLLDTPNSNTGQKGKIPVVKEDETGHEYQTIEEITGDLLPIAYTVPYQDTLVENKYVTLARFEIDTAQIREDYLNTEESISYIFRKTFTVADQLYDTRLGGASTIAIEGDIYIGSDGYIGMYSTYVAQASNGYMTNSFLSVLKQDYEPGYSDDNIIFELVIDDRYISQGGTPKKNSGVSMSFDLDVSAVPISFTKGDGSLSTITESVTNLEVDFKSISYDAASHSYYMCDRVNVQDVLRFSDATEMGSIGQTPLTVAGFATGNNLVYDNFEWYQIRGQIPSTLVIVGDDGAYRLYTAPAQGGNGQLAVLTEVFVIDATGNIVKGSIEAARGVEFPVYYQTAVIKNTPLKVMPGGSENLFFVTKAVAGEHTCFVSDADYSAGATGTAFVIGCNKQIDTTGQAIGAPVYTANSGDPLPYTFTKTSPKFQQIGTVTNVGGASDGAIGINVHQLQEEPTETCLAKDGSNAPETVTLQDLVADAATFKEDVSILLDLDVTGNIVGSRVQTASGEIRSWQGSSSYTQFHHKGNQDTTTLGFMMNADGRLLCGSAIGQTVDFRIGNVTNSGFTINDILMMIKNNAEIGGTLKIGSLAADPAIANGTSYYSTTLNAFRDCINGAWVTR